MSPLFYKLGVGGGVGLDVVGRDGPTTKLCRMRTAERDVGTLSSHASFLQPPHQPPPINITLYCIIEFPPQNFMPG